MTRERREAGTTWPAGGGEAARRPGDDLRRRLREEGGYRNEWERWRSGRQNRLLSSLAACLLCGVVAARVPAPVDPFAASAAPPSERMTVDAFDVMPVVTLQAPGVEEPAGSPGRAEAAAPAATPGRLPDEPPSTWRVEPDRGTGAAPSPAPRPLYGVAAALPPRRPTPPTLTLRARGHLDRLPAALNGPPPVEVPPQLVSSGFTVEYPDDARRARIEGRVVLRFVVEPDGRASGIVVVESLHPSCDLAAVEAVREARFIPGRDGGQPVASPTALAIRFVLYG